jgi:hypothetical protein
VILALGILAFTPACDPIHVPACKEGVNYDKCPQKGADRGDGIYCLGENRTDLMGLSEPVCSDLESMCEAKAEPYRDQSVFDVKDSCVGLVLADHYGE